MAPVSDHSPPAAIADRDNPPRSVLGTAWPLLALALILLMLVRACVPSAPPPSPPPVFDAAAATRQANAAALATLRALPAQPPLVAVLAALNRSVVNFASGSDAIPDDAIELLQQAAATIARLPAGTPIVVTGHTDNVGEPATNRQLALRRAEAVRAALIRYGAPVAALRARGMGDTQPVAGNDSEAGRFRNRRIEFSAAS
jgi:outer membrane protein OmpA-like peptidoglycan-associated protein